MKRVAGAGMELTVSTIVQETHNTRTYHLAQNDGAIDYLSGQFLTFIFKGTRGDEIRRSYSMSSSPLAGDPLTITVKRIDNGEVSRYLHDRVSVGDHLITIGASGFFTLPADISEYDNYVFFAAGSGIVPVYSMIKTLLKLKAPARILLVFSNHSIADAIFYHELIQLQIAYRNQFHIEFLFSTSLYLDRARLTPAGIGNILLGNRVDHSTRNIFYMCGPPGYMRMIQFKLTTLGVHHDDIRREIFKIEKSAVHQLPPDIGPHRIKVQNGSVEEEFIVQYPTTILAAAKKLKIPLPFSCETGQCGTCAATCIRGKVWMSNNEVLLEEELAQGKVLTCTGYPVDGDVSLLFEAL